jgi:hypothetical protein
MINLLEKINSKFIESKYLMSKPQRSMKICFATIGASGHTYPYLKFVEILVKRGHTVDWYATEDDCHPSLAPKVEAVGASYTDLPVVLPGDLTTWFRWYNHTFGFCRAVKLFYWMLTDKMKWDVQMKTLPKEINFRFMNIAYYTMASNRAQSLKKINLTKNYDLLICDMSSFGYVLSEILRIPFFNMSSFIVDLYDTPFYMEFVGGASKDLYTSAMINQKMQEAIPGWTYHKSMTFGEKAPIPVVVMSSKA